MRKDPTSQPPPGFHQLYTPRAHVRFYRAIWDAERVCRLPVDRHESVAGKIVDLMIRMKISIWVWDAETADKRAVAIRRRQAAARKRKPRVNQRLSWALRTIRSKETLSAEENAACNQALSDHRELYEDLRGRDKIADSRRELVYRNSSATLPLDNPQRSTVLTDLLLVPIWELIEGSAGHLARSERPSSRQVARLVYEIVASFLPPKPTRRLTANGIRSRVEAALLRANLKRLNR